MNFKRYHVSRNLFDGIASETNKRISISTGGSYNSQGYSISEYIPIAGGTNYIVNTSYNCYYALYDANKDYIYGGAIRNDKAIPDTYSNARFVRFDFASDDIGEIMLNEGSTALPYEPYGDTWHDTPYYIHNTSTDTLTTLPADLYADGNNATVGLKGNMEQIDTPTPSSPIQPQECGERTENLWDEEYTGIGTSITYLALNVGDGEFTMSTTAPLVSAGAPLFLLSGNVSSGASTATNGVTSQTSRTVSSTGGYITVAYRNVNGSHPEDYDTMLNSGSTALPYEPYGQYKIPISSANTTTPVYLGEVQTTRKIKKLVLTGWETWQEYQGTNAMRYNLSPIISDGVPLSTLICSHLSFGGYTATDGYAGEITGTSSTTLFRIYFWSDINTVTEWKAYLAQQYANGTPVTVWYVLATPETAVVNEPLRKIGDYADTVSGIAIPTITGKDTFDVETTLKPSEVSLTYTGWHDASVKEKSRNLFDASTIVNKIVYSNGTLANNDDYRLSEFIKVDGNVTYSADFATTTHSFIVATYDNSKNFIERSVLSDSSKTINHTGYVRICYLVAQVNNNKIMLNEGSTALPYEPYWK